MKKNNTAQKTALEVEQISKALKEGTEKTLRNLIKEAIEDIVDTDDEEVETEDEPIEDDSFEVQDVETGEEATDEPEEEPAEEPAEDGEEAEPEADDAAEGEEADDEWGDLEDFKVGDNEYDFTGVDGDLALKVYQQLADDDQINVKKEDDGSITVTDDETGAELVIELEPGDGEGAEDEDDVDVDIDAEPELDDEEPVDDDDEIEIELSDEEPADEELNEDLGYTTTYQKDVMPGLKMNEPADAKTTNDWDEGAPRGAERPWAGKGDSKPFEKQVNEGCHEEVCDKCGKKHCTCCEDEIDEAATTVSQQPVRKETMSQHKQHRPESPAEVVKVDSPKTLSESKARQIIEAAKAIQAENKQLKNALHEQAELVKKCRQSLLEAATLNVNYGKIVNLLVNESTTKAEKQSIIERFTKVNTVKEGAMLYESIKRELNESNRNIANVLNEQISAESSKTINETPIYTDNKSLNLMERMENLGKYYGKGTSFTAKADNASVNLMERLEKIK